MINILIPLILALFCFFKPEVFFRKDWDNETIEKKERLFSKIGWGLIASSILILIGTNLSAAKPPVVKDLGNQIDVSSARFHVVFEKQGEDPESYVVIMRGKISNYFCDRSLYLLPLEKAVEMRNSFGNFLKCGSKELKEAERFAGEFIALAADAQARKKIEEITDSNKHFGKFHCPVIKLDGVQLKPLNFSIIEKGKEVPCGHEESERYFLIKDIKIIDYFYTKKE